MQPSTHKGLFIALGTTLLAVLLLYHQVWLDPNGVVMGASNDALKNYYTPWYHAQWDEGYVWFGGMNHPYGEHLVFADAQPLLSNTIKLLGLARWTVAIMNLSMLLGLVAAAGLLHQVLRRWRMSQVWTGLAAAGIALLSPQALKFNAHFALGYAWVVPLVWLLALRAYEQPSWLRSGTVALAVFVVGWLHPYYVMISVVFLACFGFMHALLAWRSLGRWARLMHLLLQVALPVVAFALVLKLTDPVTDRPSDPYGFDRYMASWKSLFLPVAVWGMDLLPNALWGKDAVDWEGIGYVGLVGTMAFLAYWGRTTVLAGRRLLRRERGAFAWLPWQAEGEETHRLLLVSMLAGVAVGVFSCGFPFAFKPELTTELFPPIKQFRTLGRFSWVFYYTWTAFAAYLLWRWRERLLARKLGWANGVSYVGLLLFLVEGLGANAGVAMRVADANPHHGASNLVLGRPAPAFADRLAAHDALIVLPYFHIGSENFYADDPPNAAAAFQLSLITGKPMLNVMMSRTSLAQTWAMLQLVTEPCQPLELLQRQPVFDLLAVRTGDSITLDPLVQPTGNAERIDSFLAYSLHLDAAHVDRFLGPQPSPAATFPTGSPLVASAANEAVIWHDFEDGTVAGYQGQGKEISLKDNNLLWDGTMPFRAGDTVLVSLWARLRGDRLPLALLGWEELNGDEKVNWHYLDINRNLRRMDGEWALVERMEVIRDPAHQFLVNMTRWKRRPPTLVIDNLLIRRKGVDVYLPGPAGYRMRNNAYSPFAPALPDTAATK